MRRPGIPWTLKTQNHYLNVVVETFGYAETHLKMITPQQNLAAVKRHKVHVDNEDLAYKSAEVFQLLLTLSTIDLRAWVVAEFSYVGGRRITAIRTLRASCYSIDTRIMGGEALEFGVVTFPAKTDKARRKGAVYLFGPPKDAIEALLQTPAVQASGLLFPKGELDSASPPELPITEKVLRAWLREAEESCGIDQVKDRSYHGFNRTFATDIEDEKAASSQSGKTEETIRRIYRQPKPAEKAALAMQLDGLRRGA